MASICQNYLVASILCQNPIFPPRRVVVTTIIDSWAFLISLLRFVQIQSVDVVCVNRYQGWYSLGGRLDLIRHHVVQEMQAWSDTYRKPVILTEYGAEALAGYHAVSFSLLFQVS